MPYNNFNMMRPNMGPMGKPNDDRFIGGFAFPFLLGGVTGAALAPNFFRPPVPPYYYPNYYYRPYPRYYY